MNDQLTTSIYSSDLVLYGEDRERQDQRQNGLISEPQRQPAMQGSHGSHGPANKTMVPRNKVKASRPHGKFR